MLKLVVKCAEDIFTKQARELRFEQPRQRDEAEANTQRDVPFEVSKAELREYHSYRHGPWTGKHCNLGRTWTKTRGQ